MKSGENTEHHCAKWCIQHWGKEEAGVEYARLEHQTKYLKLKL